MFSQRRRNTLGYKHMINSQPNQLLKICKFKQKRYLARSEKFEDTS